MKKNEESRVADRGFRDTAGFPVTFFVEAAFGMARDTAGEAASPDRLARVPAGLRAEYHEPVLLRETVELLGPAPGKVIVDGTLGGGGHSRALLEGGASVIGLDQDADALAFASERLGEWRENLRLVHANFRDLEDVLERLGVAGIDGALLDLGVSSRQLESPERGFSFLRNGPLDMRMDSQRSVTAADLVNNASGAQLEAIFRNFGEEPAARRIAAYLVRERHAKPFRDTFDLAQIVERAIGRHGKTHPATRVFQALRIAVNRELEALSEGLEQFTARLKPGGRLAVITFHSLEDRIVKNFFKSRSALWIDRPEWPEARPNPDRLFKSMTRKPLLASDEEQSRNPRSRSAKLRVAEKV